MKKLKLFALLMAAVVAMTACTQPEEPEGPKDEPTPEEPTPEVKAPVVTLSQSAVELNAAGNAVSISYTIDNPIEGEHISATSEASWLSVDSATVGTLTLSATKNTATEARTTTLTISYKNAESVSLNVSQKRAEGLTFELNFSDVAYDSFILQIIPSESNKSFYIGTLERSVYEQFESADALFRSEMERVREMADNAWLSFSEMLASLTYKGEKWQAFNQLRPETEYVAFAVGITSSGTRTSDFSYNYVTTTAEPTVDMDFTISANEWRHSLNIVITPANKRTPYVWDIFSAEEIEAFKAQFGCSSAEECYQPIMRQRVEAAAKEGVSIEEFYASIIKKGTQRCSNYECTPATTYYIMAAALNRSCVPGAVTLGEITSAPAPTPGCSDNEIRVELSNPSDTYVQIGGEASNMDPYLVLVLPTELCESMDDAALFAYIVANFTSEEIESNIYEGGFAGIYGGLEPSTAYTGIGVGYDLGVMTTPTIYRSASISTLAAQ